jgi:putative DNA primase/helicase
LGRENTVSPKLSQLRQDFGAQQLIGKKAAFFSDERLGSNTLPIVEWLLSVSGEDDVSIPRKHQRNWQGRLPLKVWIATNPMPNFEDASAVIASRFILFKLKRSFLGKEDPKLTETLLRELPGIFNWAIEGLRMLREDGEFYQTPEAQDELDLMADVSAPIRRFVRDRMVVSPDRGVEARSAYTAYDLWCKANGNKPMSKGKFLTAIADAVPAIDHCWRGARGHQVETLCGIGLRQAGEDATDEPEPELPANDDLLSMTAGEMRS